MQKKESLSQTSSEIVIPRQKKKSVYTSFNFKKSSHNGLSWLSKYYGINRKLFFDFLTPDHFIEKALCLIKESNKSETTEQGVRKTYLINKATLEFLKEISVKEKIPRDILIETLICIWVSNTEKRYKEERMKYKKALELVEGLWERSEDVRCELANILGDDPIVTNVSHITFRIDDIVEEINDALKNNTKIDPDFEV